MPGLKVAGAASRKGHPCELALQQVDPRDVAADVVGAASLARRESEPPARVRIAQATSAQVDHGCEVLTLWQRGGGEAVALERSSDLAIEQRRGHLHGIA